MYENLHTPPGKSKTSSWLFLFHIFLTSLHCKYHRTGRLLCKRLLITVLDIFIFLMKRHICSAIKCCTLSFSARWNFPWTVHVNSKRSARNERTLSDEDSLESVSGGKLPSKDTFPSDQLSIMQWQLLSSLIKPGSSWLLLEMLKGQACYICIAIICFAQHKPKSVTLINAFCCLIFWAGTSQ